MSLWQITCEKNEEVFADERVTGLIVNVSVFGVTFPHLRFHSPMKEIDV